MKFQKNLIINNYSFWISSASHPTGFFCAVKSPASEGFTNLTNSLCPSKNHEKLWIFSLILCSVWDRKEYSFYWEKVIIRWHSPQYKYHPLKRFLALVGGVYFVISQPVTTPCNYSYGSIKTNLPRILRKNIAFLDWLLQNYLHFSNEVLYLLCNWKENA